MGVLPNIRLRASSGEVVTNAGQSALGSASAAPSEAEQPASNTVPASAKEDARDWLPTYAFYGLHTKRTGDQGIGQCFLCNKDNKFYVNSGTGQYQCKSCDASGNVYTFLAKLHEASVLSTPADEQQKFALSKGILSGDSLRAWGMAQSVLDGSWLVPSYSVENKLNNLLAYRLDRESGKWRWYSGTGLGVSNSLMGLSPDLYNPTRPYIHVCEGVFDAIMYWETMGYAVEKGDKIEKTDDVDAAMRHSVNVVAVPGCNVFGEKLYERFHHRDVTLLYDNDHPRKLATGQTQLGGGISGMERVTGILTGSPLPPEKVNFLRWGKEGDGFSLKLANGYDVRDYLTSDGTDRVKRIKRLEGLRKLISATPIKWHKVPEEQKADLPLIACESWREVVEAGSKVLVWDDNFSRTLAIMYAVAASTKCVGTSLWAKVMAPAAGGKTTLAEALSVCKKFAHPVSTLTGMHSGFKTDKNGEEDHSLLAKCLGKTLIIKDGDTLLKAPDRERIFAELRDLYDRKARVHYRHGINRNYESIDVSIILCGTGSLREMDSSELGERFLDVILIDKIDPIKELEIGFSAGMAEARGVSIETGDKESARELPESIYFKQVAGGYFGYLRDNASKLLKKIDVESSVNREAIRRCAQLAQLVAFMRARPAIVQKETVEREMCYRLTKQLTRLAMMLTIVTGKDEIDAEVMRMVHRTAIDTAGLKTMEIASLLYYGVGDNKEKEVHNSTLAVRINEKEEDCLKLMNFLRKINVIETVKRTTPAGMSSGAPKYKLTQVFSNLYKTIMEYEYK